MFSDPFRKCQFAMILNARTKEYKYDIGFISNNLKILDQIRIKNKKYGEKGYVYQCLKCGYTNKVSESNFIKHKCPICSSHKIQVGTNDMWTTNPELAKLLANPENGYKYTQYSSKKVDWKCPDCGNIIKNKNISNINKRGLSCPICSDGISYPEKIMYNLLKQLSVNFEYQYSPEWCKYQIKEKLKRGRYDFYIPSKQIIIEMDGALGHGNNDTKSLTKEDSKEIDNIKDELARQHNIEVIRINCNYNNSNKFEYIKTNICQNKISSIINLSNLNWNIINANSQKSLIKKVCKYKYDFPDATTFEIAKLFNINYQSVTKYLKTGNKLGWCYYNTKEESIKNGRKSGKLQCRKVICITTGNIYNSITEAENQTNATNISLCCLHSKKYHHTGKLSDGTPMIWMFYDEYIKSNNNLTI